MEISKLHPKKQVLLPWGNSIKIPVAFSSSLCLTLPYRVFVSYSVCLSVPKRYAEQSSSILKGSAMQTFSSPAFILLEGNIQMPMELILNTPVSSCQCCIIGGFRLLLVTDVVTDITGYPILDFADGFYLYDGISTFSWAIQKRFSLTQAFRI